MGAWSRSGLVTSPVETSTCSYCTSVLLRPREYYIYIYIHTHVAARDLALSGPVHPRVLDCSECNNVTGRYARSTTIIRHVHGYLLPITSLLFAAKNTNNVRMHLALEDFDSGVRVSGYYLCNFYCHVK